MQNPILSLPSDLARAVQLRAPLRRVLRSVPSGAGLVLFLACGHHALREVASAEARCVACLDAPGHTASDFGGGHGG